MFGLAQFAADSARRRKRKGRKSSKRKSSKRKSRRDSRVTAWARATGGGRKRKSKRSRKGGASRGSRSTIMSRKTRRKINRERHRSLMKKTRGWSKGKRARYATAGDYIRVKRMRKETYGPIPFAHQPTWVRALGRKQKAGKSRRRRSRR